MAKMQRLIWVFVLAMVFFCNGCGIVALLGTPGAYEGEIAAEYAVGGVEGQKILVYVEQAAWLGAEANLRFYITETINQSLIKKVEIEPERIVSYRELSAVRSKTTDFSRLSLVEVGEAVGADVVVFVMIDDYRLSRIGDTDYYKGYMAAESVIFDVAKGEKVWPASEKSKAIKVGFEVERRGREFARIRLVSGLSHCLVRYLYDCPKEKFKIADDMSGVGWENWME